MVTGQDSITYSLSIANSGPSDAQGVVVTDTLPAGVTFVGASAGCSGRRPASVTCTLGTLAAGATTSFSVGVTSMPTSSTGRP